MSATKRTYDRAGRIDLRLADDGSASVLTTVN
jgi:hypothetical protein